jgi:hypothetical protein
MKTISDIIKNTDASSAPITHIYDVSNKKIYDAETHKHLRKVRDDLASGRPVWIPKRKA